MVNIIKPKLTPEQEKLRSGWKYRALEATRGNQTKLGCILIRVCGRMPKNPPRFDIKNGALILPGGMIIANFQPDQRTPFKTSAVCRVEELVSELRRLADKLKLGDAEREEMFRMTREWITHDARSTSDPQIAEDRLKLAKKMARRRLH